MPRLEDGTFAEVMISTFSTITRMTMSSIASNIYSNTIVKSLKERFAIQDIKKSRKQWVDFVKILYTNDDDFLTSYLKDIMQKNDKELKEFFDDLHMIVRPFSEPPLKNLVEYSRSEKITVEQRLQVYDEETEMFSKMKKTAICGYTPIKFLTQLVSKKTNQSHKVNDINANTGTLTEGAKIAKFGREEANAMFSYGTESTILPEFLTVRADDTEARLSMDKIIIEEGEVNLKDIKSTGQGQISNLIAFNLLGAGYDSSFRADITAKEEGGSLDIR